MKQPLITEELLNKYPDERTEITGFFTKVTGTSFREKENPGVLALVNDEDYVLIQPEFGNEYDPHACRVLHNNTGNHIGYLQMVDQAGKELSKEVWKNIVQEGDLYIGRVTRTGGTAAKKNIGFNLEVKRLHISQDPIPLQEAK